VRHVYDTYTYSYIPFDIILNYYLCSCVSVVFNARTCASLTKFELVPYLFDTSVENTEIFCSLHDQGHFESTMQLRSNIVLSEKFIEEAYDHQLEVNGFKAFLDCLNSQRNVSREDELFDELLWCSAITKDMEI